VLVLIARKQIPDGMEIIKQTIVARKESSFRIGFLPLSGATIANDGWFYTQG